MARFYLTEGWTQPSKNQRTYHYFRGERRRSVCGSTIRASDSDVEHVRQKRARLECQRCLKQQAAYVMREAERAKMLKEFHAELQQSEKTKTAASSAR